MLIFVLLKFSKVPALPPPPPPFQNPAYATVYAKCLERKGGEIAESKLKDGQCGFRPGRSTADQGPHDRTC